MRLRHAASAVTLLLSPLACLSFPVLPSVPSIPESFGTAGEVVSGKIHAGIGSCSEAQLLSKQAASSCHAYLKVGHVYKGLLRPGEEVTIDYRLDENGGMNWTPSSPARLLAGDDGFLLVFLCNPSPNYLLCPQTAGVDHMSPLLSKSSTSQGLTLLADDAVAGLSSRLDMDVVRSIGILLQLDVRNQIPRLLATKKRVSWQTALYIDRLLAQSGDYQDIKPDLEAALGRPDSETRTALMPLVGELMRATSPEMVSELPLLIKSSQVNVRMLALKIVQENPGSVPIAVLREMLDDPDPTLAFTATAILEQRAGVSFLHDRPAFGEFIKNPAMRNAYLSDWKNWFANSAAK
jgi:hypothetical protein